MKGSILTRNWIGGGNVKRLQGEEGRRSRTILDGDETEAEHRQGGKEEGAQRHSVLVRPSFFKPGLIGIDARP